MRALEGPIVLTSSDGNGDGDETSRVVTEDAFSELSDNIEEQVVRPTGLVDPEVEIRPVATQVDDVLSEINATVANDERVLITTLTHNPAALHLDEEYCREHTEFGQRLVNSCLTLSLMVGISVHETTLGTAVANLGWDEVRFPAPLFHGDTIRVESEVLELRESRSRPDNGIVVFAHRAFNQHDVLVGTCTRTALMLRKPAD